MDQVSIQIFEYTNQFLRNESPQIDLEEARTKNQKLKTAEIKKSELESRNRFFSDLQFLTFFYKVNDYLEPTVIMIGSAPGDHIPLLSLMFPSLKFECYDDRQFNITETDTISLHPMMTLEEAHSLSEKGNNILLISHYLRSSYQQIYQELVKQNKTLSLPLTPKQLKEEARNRFQIGSQEDMIFQQQLLQNINPRYGLLRFLLPTPRNENDQMSRYLNGLIILTPWSSTNNNNADMTSLIVTKINSEWKFRDWNLNIYQKQVQYHNLITREDNFYLDPITNEGINLFDITLEKFILGKYTLRTIPLGKGRTLKDFNPLISKLQDKISSVTSPIPASEKLRQESAKQRLGIEETQASRIRPLTNLKTSETGGTSGLSESSATLLLKSKFQGTKGVTKTLPKNIKSNPIILPSVEGIELVKEIKPIVRPAPKIFLPTRPVSNNFVNESNLISNKGGKINIPSLIPLVSEVKEKSVVSTSD